MADLTVAFIGAGTMGAPMARNAASAGIAVRVWNRTREKAEAVEGAEVADSPAAAVDGADALVTILSDGAAVEEAVAGALREGVIWAQMSTVGIAATERLAALADEHRTTFVDAPVLGTKLPAEKGELTALASGPRDARERLGPLFDAVAARTVELGEAGEGTRLKLVLNTWLNALVAALGETISFAEAIGVDPRTFLDTIDGGPLGPAYAQMKGKLMIERDFPPSFALELARKDAGLVLEAAERHGFDAELTKTIVRVFDRAIAAGHGGEDMAAAIYGYSKEEGA
jgi:3-hydroxyisobutyrate dehydrogenase